MPHFSGYTPDAVVEAYRRNTMDLATNPFFYADEYDVLRCSQWRCGIVLSARRCGPGLDCVS